MFLADFVNAHWIIPKNTFRFQIGKTLEILAPGNRFRYFKKVEACIYLGG